MPRRKKSSQENQSRSSLSINKDKPQQRYAANARERARMRVLSRAFCRLKTTLPWVPADTKLSKLDTLRLAASYIAHLKGILRDETLGSSESSLHPAMSMTWPFGFNRPLGGSTGGGSHEGGSILGSDEEDDEDVPDDDDVESISSCTWEEASPPSSAKDCVHLDATSSGRNSTRRGGRTRGKGNSDNNNYINTSSKPTPSVHRKETPSSDSKKHHLTKNNNVAIRPLSQNLQQHQQQQNHHLNLQHEHDYYPENPVMFQHQLKEDTKLSMSPLNGMVAVTNLENAPPPPMHQHSLDESHHHHTEVFVGVGDNQPYLTDMNSASYSTASEDQLHHLNHQHNSNDVHHHQHHHLTFGFGSGDLIPIG